MDCTTSPVFEIYQGNAKIMNLKAVYLPGYAPVDLTNCTEIVISLLNADGSSSLLKLSQGQVSIITPAVLGNFQASAAAIGGISSLLNVGDLQTFYATLTISGYPITIPYVGALSVFQQP